MPVELKKSRLIQAEYLNTRAVIRVRRCVELYVADNGRAPAWLGTCSLAYYIPVGSFKSGETHAANDRQISALLLRIISKCSTCSRRLTRPNNVLHNKQHAVNTSLGR